MTPPPGNPTRHVALSSQPHGCKSGSAVRRSRGEQAARPSSLAQGPAGGLQVSAPGWGPDRQGAYLRWVRGSRRHRCRRRTPSGTPARRHARPGSLRAGCRRSARTLRPRSRPGSGCGRRGARRDARRAAGQLSAAPCNSSVPHPNLPVSSPGSLCDVHGSQ